ncbi:hypothetical protein LTS08_000252 [Lithohypha guttulata]|uniref:DUF3533 domain-containing protein n=1 Tax=Lithohypha guttulata TaxID=1690604 RepID=A0AAN7Y9Z7_9EURO|nr:hypothetical protein LTR51_007126 [Lithohypha guttulata]KAK5084314.1 hypothetical protein LTR05_005390 [Lithohypha guttulata]KAK5106135.1 hypothetical protein LTS08_000252 [Lithohypha guttulata]
MFRRHSTYNQSTTHSTTQSTSTSSTAVEDEDGTVSITTPTPPGYDDYVERPKAVSYSQGFNDQAVKDLFQVLNTVDGRQVARRFTEESQRPHSPLLYHHTAKVQSTDEEKAKPTPPAPVGFWHHDLSHTRILSIYWGVIFNVKKNMPNVTVAVVSFEGVAPYQDYTPIVGPFIRQACEAEMASRPDHLGFEFRDPAEYNNDPTNVRLAVHNEDIWAAIIINSNATALLQEAVATGNTSYDPRGAASIVYIQARDVESYNFHIVPVLDSLALAITTNFGSYWARTVFANSSLDVATYSRAPQAVSPGISFTMLNLRPFDPPAAIPTITIGLIYLIIIAFFSFTFFIPTHMKFVLPNPAAPHPPLKFVQLIIYRWCATMVAYFFLSLAYSLVSLAFLIPFSNTPPVGSALDVNHGWSNTEPILNANPFGRATWIVYWMLNFVGMAALGLACENMAMLLSYLSPLPYSALFLIFWVITNVSTGFYALELASDFYRWGYAWPLRHIVRGSKALVFGTKDELDLNFGVLFAWVFVSTLLFPAACWVMRQKAIRDRRRAAEEEAEVGRH